MQLDAVISLGGGIRIKVEGINVKVIGSTLKLENEELRGMFVVGDVVQAVTIMGYRFHRRTFVIHAEDEETGEYTCTVLAQDKGRYKDPTIQEDLAVWNYVEEEEEDEEEEDVEEEEDEEEEAVKSLEKAFFTWNPVSRIESGEEEDA